MRARDCDGFTRICAHSRALGLVLSAARARARAVCAFYIHTGVRAHEINTVHATKRGANEKALACARARPTTAAATTATAAASIMVAKRDARATRAAHRYDCVRARFCLRYAETRFARRYKTVCMIAEGARSISFYLCYPTFVLPLLPLSRVVRLLFILAPSLSYMRRVRTRAPAAVVSRSARNRRRRQRRLQRRLCVACAVASCRRRRRDRRCRRA